MAVTFTKVILNTIPVIKIDGVGPSPIYVRVPVVKFEFLKSNSGIQRAIGAHVIEVDIQGVDIPNSEGPTHTINQSPESIADKTITGLSQLRTLRRRVIKDFLVARINKEEFNTIPTDITDIEGEI